MIFLFNMHNFVVYVGNWWLVPIYWKTVYYTCKLGRVLPGQFPGQVLPKLSSKCAHHSAPTLGPGLVWYEITGNISSIYSWFQSIKLIYSAWEWDKQNLILKLIDKGIKLSKINICSFLLTSRQRFNTQHLCTRIYCFAIIRQNLQGFTKQIVQFMQIAGSLTIIYSVRILVAAIEREERCNMFYGCFNWSLLDNEWYLWEG